MNSGPVPDLPVYADVVNLWSRLTPGSHKRAVWLCSPSTLPKLLTLVVATNVSHVPILKEANGSYSLLGRELIVNEHLSALGTEGDLLLADLTQYEVLMRSDISLMISPHIYFDSDQLGFRLLARLDGQSMQSNAVTPANGGDTLSPFVTLTDAAG